MKKKFNDLDDLPVTSGVVSTDDEWIVACPKCENEQEYSGYFDPNDPFICDECGQKFLCSEIVEDDSKIK